MAMDSLKYPCNQLVVDFLNSRKELFDEVVKKLGKITDISITVSTILSSVMVEPSAFNPNFFVTCDAVIKQFLADFKSASVNCEVGLLTAAKTSKPALFESERNVDVCCFEDGKVSVSGFGEDVDRKLRDLLNGISHVASSVEIKYRSPCSEHDHNMLNTCVVLDELNSRFVQKPTITYCPDDESVEYEGFHVEVMTAKEEVEEFLKGEHAASRSVDKSTNVKIKFKCDKHSSEFITKFWPGRHEVLAQISFDMVDGGLQLEGLMSRVHRALYKLHGLSTKIQQNNLTYNIPGLAPYFLTSDWMQHKSSVETKLQCVIAAGKSFPSESGMVPDPDLEQHLHSLTTSRSLPDDIYRYGIVAVTVSSGDITHNNSDVILNGCGSDFNLNSGILSKSINQQAGPRMQLECDQAPLYKTADLRVTLGYNLPCKHVIHLAVSASLERLENRVKEALKYADRMGATSIGIPALGTGRLGMSASDVAKSFRNVLVEVAESAPEHIKAINFVIYDSSDVDTFRKTILPMQKFQTFAEKEKEQLETAKVKVQDAACGKVQVLLCGQDVTKLQEAKELLDQKFREVMVEEEMVDDLFLKFSSHDAFDVYVAAARCAVDINIDNPPVIKLRGLKGSVDEMKDLIKEIRFEYREAITHTKICSWKWSPNDREFHQFPLRVSREIELKYEESPKGHASVSMCGNLLSINFSSMKINFGVGTREHFQWSIKRVEPSRISGVPSEWDDMSGRSWKKVQVLEETSEYQKVAAQFNLKNSSKRKIAKIERIQNPTLYEQFMIKRKHVERHLTSNNPVERELFHGTSESDAEKICTHGFDRGFAGKNGVVYGNGVYFARDSSYSMSYSLPNASGTSVMFLAQVLTGDFCRGSNTMRAAPPKRTSGNDDQLYDSVVDNTSSPKIFVVFKDSSVYPSYLISYK